MIFSLLLFRIRFFSSIEYWTFLFPSADFYDLILLIPIIIEILNFQGIYLANYLFHCWLPVYFHASWMDLELESQANSLVFDLIIFRIFSLFLLLFYSLFSHTLRVVEGVSFDYYLISFLNSWLPWIIFSLLM